MSVTEILGGLGSWSLRLTDSTPDEVRKAVGFFGHVAIVDGPVDVGQSGDALLTAARYVGVLRHGAGTLEPGGSGMAYWLGDEDDKGPVVETAASYTSQTLAAVVTDLLTRTAAVTAGTIHPQANPAQRYSGEHQYQTVRNVLDSVTDVFGAEYRVNGNATLDVGTAAQLYGATPQAVVKRRGAGTDLDLTGVGGDFEPTNDVYDFSTRVVLLGQTQDDRTIATGAADAPSVPYNDPRGNPVKVVRLINESGETAASVAQRAQLQINRYYRVKRAVNLDLADYESDARARVGGSVWVYDPDTGLVDTSNEVFFRGEVLHPVRERVTGATWAVREGVTVAFRAHSGAWVDLTPFVEWETGSDELTVGDLATTLTRPGSEIQDRLDTTRGVVSGEGPLNTVAPKPPTGLALSTTSTLDSAGRDVPVVTATWTAPTQNVDNTTLTDLEFYTVQWHWTARGIYWSSTTTGDTTIDLPVSPGLPYEVRVLAVDSDGEQSAWSTIASITSAKDSTAPPTPSDPAVTSYLGQLRIEWNGLSSTGGAMPADFNRLDVHVGTTSGFTPSTSTLVSSLSTKGVAYATAPYGVTRYVRFLAYDHQENASGASGTVAGATAQVGDGDIASLSVGKLTAGTMSADVTVSGRLATALTGTRAEVNAAGFQAWSGTTQTVSLTGSNNLLTGTFRTALTGRRIEMLSSGAVGDISLYAADGRRGFVRSHTESSGVEAIQIGMTHEGTTNSLWNRININASTNGEYTTYRSGTHEFVYDSTAPNTAGKFIVFQTENRTAGSTDVRFEIKKDGTWSYYPLEGQYVVAFRSSSTGVSGNRIFINADFTALYHSVSKQTGVYERLNDGSSHERFRVGPGVAVFAYPNVSQRVQINRNDTDTSGNGSPFIQWVNQHGYGATTEWRSNDVGAFGALHFRNVIGTGYVNISAAAFNVNSARASKKDIKDAGPMSAKLRALAAKTYQLNDDKGTARRLGFIAEELPTDFAALDETGTPAAADLYALVTAAITYGQELDTRLAALEKSK